MAKDAENKKKRSRVKILHILLTVFVLILIAACVFGYINRENLWAAYYAYHTSTEELEAQKKENDKRIHDALNSLTEVQMRELTDEERKMLENGEITNEDAIKLVTGREAEKEVAINRKESLIAQVYVLRASYTSKIEGLIANAKKEYIALQPSERTVTAKMALADSLISQGNALEGECDAKMNSLLDSLSEELGKLGEDTSIISEIKSIYDQEKRIKKASLMGLYDTN